MKAYLGPSPQDAPSLIRRITRLKTVRDRVRQYEFEDKIAEINQKRQVSGWTDVALELVNMAADITTLVTSPSGVGAAVGQGLKAAVGGGKLAHGAAKLIQKLYRNRNPAGAKSAQTKHREYVAHTRFIFEQIANLKLNSPSLADDCRQVEQYILVSIEDCFMP